MANWLDGMAKHNLDLLKSGNFSDAEIFCRGRTWKVHKVILQSRCAWFKKAFANNWLEAQTGQIHLEQEEPARIDEILKFIYSGQYFPDLEKDTQSTSLGNTVSRWRTADFFLLPDFKTSALRALINSLVFALICFHDFRLSQVVHGTTNKDIKDTLDPDMFFIDFPSAVEKAYECPAARELQKLFAISACGLREHLPESIRQELNKKIPSFHQDVSFVLTILHFPQAANEPKVAAMLGDPYVFVPGRTHSLWPSKRSDYLRCSGCGEEGPANCGPPDDPYEGWDMTLDPFSFGTRKWCTSCDMEQMELRLRDILIAWPYVMGEPKMDLTVAR